MTRRYWRLFVGGVICLVSVLACHPLSVTDSLEETGSSSVSDRIQHPAIEQRFENGDFQLVIRAVDDWDTPRAIAQLYESDSLRWERPLPHGYGPRYAVVGPQGQVLLLDEYINVASDYAIALFSPQGQQIAQYSFDDIQQKAAVPAAKLTRQATSGWWISAPPPSSAPTNQVIISTGGTTLTIHLLTGELSRRDI